jgi:hypothetical protein
MKHLVQIKQTLYGWIEIEADTPDQAWDIAHNRYNHNGEELPDMEALDELYIQVIEN